MRDKKFRGSLKDSLYKMDNSKVWSCAFFSCEGGKQQKLAQLSALSQAEQGTNPPAYQSPATTAAPKTTDRLDTLPARQADTTRVAVLRIDAELKRLILALLKQKQPQQSSEDSHCQDMIKGIAYQIHHSPDRTQLAGRTKGLALDMQYYCRKQHFLKAYDSYQKLIAILDAE